MSLSWTEQARTWFVPRATAGLSIGRDYVGLIELCAVKGGWQAVRLIETKLDVPLFQGKPSLEALAGFTGALEKIAPVLKNRYLPLHVSLPDAAVRLSVLELEQLPGTHVERIALARWHGTRDTAAGETVVCACQPLGTDGNKHLLLTLTMAEAWHQRIEEALRNAGMVAWSLSANASRQFNRFHAQLTAQAGALVVISPDSWALWLWDASGRPRYARVRWRSAAGKHVEIVAEIERMILAYVHGAPNRAVKNVFVVLGEDEDGLVATLDERLPCTRLRYDEKITFMDQSNREVASIASLSAAAVDT